jgi:hypothetical protein
MASARYRQLVRQDKIARRHLFPVKRDWSLVSPSKQEAMKALAYRMFSHAELESYFEDLAIDLISVCDTAYTDTRKVSVTSVGILSYSGRGGRSPPDKTASWKDSYFLEQEWKTCVSSHFQAIKAANNGIKERNILRMFVPLGIEPKEIDPLLLSELNSFGQLRGSVAHTSLRHSLSPGINPKLEFDRFDGIMTLLLDFDSLVSAKRRLAR